MLVSNCPLPAGAGGRAFPCVFRLCLMRRALTHGTDTCRGGCEAPSCDTGTGGSLAAKDQTRGAASGHAHSPFEQPCHHLRLSYSDQQLLLNVSLGEVQTWKG